MSKTEHFISPTIKDILIDEEIIDRKITIAGRLSRFRSQKKMIFGTISDGSCTAGLQFVYKQTEDHTEGILKLMECGCVGTSVRATGIIVESPAKGQRIELQLIDIDVLSIIRDPGTYSYSSSMMKKKDVEVWDSHLKSIRSDTYMRFRHPVMQSIMSIRSDIKAALYVFFTSLQFKQIDSPILTKSDCEGAGEMFQVTTLDIDGTARDGTISKLTDYKKDFFCEKAHLTVSGQLEAEAIVQTMGRVFTFGPTFRAENSHTSRHLAEFWMLEPELVLSDKDSTKRYSQLLDLEELMVKQVISTLLTTSSDCLVFLQETISPGLIERLTEIKDSVFERISYTEAIDILTTHSDEGIISFTELPVWGMDLKSEHEQYLCEIVYKKPTFVMHYPQDLKSFYMKADDECKSDRQTCQAVDLLVPGIGELCGGSMREDDPEKLMSVMRKKSIPTEGLEWYIDLRYDGGLPTGGFGLGFERFVRFITGVRSIRDVIPFPKYPGHI